MRPLAEGERARLEAGLRAADAFTLRRPQVRLASARGEPPPAIARALGCSVQTVRNAIRAFHAEGPDCLLRKSNRPRSAAPVLGGDAGERLRGLLHQSPRAFGKGASLWTLALAARVCHEQGLTGGPSATRPSAAPCCAWASAGSGPGSGSAAPTPPTREKKRASG